MQSHKHTITRHISLFSITLGALGLLAILAGCSSDSSPPNSNSSNSSTISGVITGFGSRSIFVNGVEYETSNASILEEGNSTTEDALSIGMVVTLQGSVNDDGMTGTATHISYDDNVEGIVFANTIAVDGKLDVMGQIVDVNDDTTFESNVVAVTQPSEIAVGNVVEISGYTSGEGMILATRIEVKSETYTTGDKIEVKGIIGADVTASQFMIGTLVIDYSTATLDGLPAMLVAGTYVEAQGRSGVDIATRTMVASKIELEHDDMDDNEGNEVEIEGTVSNVISETEFEINGTPVLHNSATEFEYGTAADIVSGALLEVEGTFDIDGKLVAEEIEFRKGAEIEVEAYIDAIDLDNSNVSIFGKFFQINNLTTMQDDSADDMRIFSLNDLEINDRVELHAYIDATTGSFIATSLEKQDYDTSDLSIEGPVDADVATGADSFTMFGVTVDLATNGLIIPATTLGSEVELEGNFSGDQFIATDIDD